MSGPIGWRRPWEKGRPVRADVFNQSWIMPEVLTPVHMKLPIVDGVRVTYFVYGGGGIGVAGDGLWLEECHEDRNILSA